MSNVDSGVVFLPRFTVLVGATTFTTAPMDVSRQGGVQFQIWRGPIRATGGTPSLMLYLEESLDGRTWVLGPATPSPIPVEEEDLRFCSYSFRLRWFRLRLALAGTDPMVSCWAEGLLRGADGSGVWGASRLSPAGEVAGRSPTEPRVIDPASLLRARPAPWESTLIEDSAGRLRPLLPGEEMPPGYRVSAIQPVPPPAPVFPQEEGP